MDYTKLVSLKYKNVNYNMYVDDYNRHYFLKKDEFENLYYPEINELIDLAIHFVNIPNVMNAEGNTKKNKIIPKVIIAGTAVTLTGALIAGFFASNYFKKQKQYEVYDTPEIITSVEQYLSDNSYKFEKNGNIKLDTYTGDDNSYFITINDTDYLDKIFDYTDVSIEQMKSAVASNPNISGEFKTLTNSYIDNLYAKYPNMDKRVLYENLKTLKVYEVDETELLTKTFNSDSVACYIDDENSIYVLHGCKFEYGSWDYQVGCHELSHAAGSYKLETENHSITVSKGGQNYDSVIVNEALNSIFAVSTFNPDEKDVAYQLQSNYFKIILDSMDNYTLEDYANHSLSYFIKKLNEQNNNDDGIEMLNLLEVQYDDYHSDELEISQDQYYRLYDYISNMYYRKYITSDMSYDEALEVKNRMMDTILFDVPSEYNIDTAHFDEYFDNYCNTLGISGLAR